MSKDTRDNFPSYRETQTFPDTVDVHQEPIAMTFVEQLEYNRAIYKDNDGNHYRIRICTGFFAGTDSYVIEEELKEYQDGTTEKV